LKADNQRYFRLKGKASEDDDDDAPNSKEFISYSNSTLTLSRLTVYLDEPIQDARYYRPLIEHISQLSESDSVLIKIDSPGGNLAGAIALVNAIQDTDASVHVMLTGQCCSAATLIALCAPSISTYPQAYMMFHSAAFGSVGKQENVEGHVKFMSSRIRELLKNVYADFLTPQEISDMNKGMELWMDTDEIELRLAEREQKQQAAQIKEQELKLKHEEKAKDDGKVQESKSVASKGPKKAS